MKPTQLKVKSNKESLALIRKAVSDAGEKAGMDKSVLGQIMLAVDETCSNIIRHTYQSEPEKKIVVNISITADLFTITIKDEGAPFDITSLEPRDITDVKPGGLGVYIIQQVMDSIEYCRTEDGCNQVTLTKKL